MNEGCEEVVRCWPPPAFFYINKSMSETSWWWSMTWSAHTHILAGRESAWIRMRHFNTVCTFECYVDYVPDVRTHLNIFTHLGAFSHSLSLSLSHFHRERTNWKKEIVSESECMLPGEAGWKQRKSKTKRANQDHWLQINFEIDNISCTLPTQPFI